MLRCTVRLHSLNRTTAIGVRTFAHVPGRFLDVITFEVKPAEAVDVTAVYEALSHRRSATESYVIFHIADDELLALELTLTEICAEARSHGIGVIVAGDPQRYETWDERVQAERHEPDPARLDDFVESQVSEALGKDVAKGVR